MKTVVPSAACVFAAIIGVSWPAARAGAAPVGLVRQSPVSVVARGARRRCSWTSAAWRSGTSGSRRPRARPVSSPSTSARAMTDGRINRQPPGTVRYCLGPGDARGRDAPRGGAAGRRAQHAAARGRPHAAGVGRRAAVPLGRDRGLAGRTRARTPAAPGGVRHARGTTSAAAFSLVRRDCSTASGSCAATRSRPRPSPASTWMATASASPTRPTPT